MANMHLVTGHAGTAHVTSADQGSFNAAMFGPGQYVLNRGNKLAATVVTNNKITISDGALLMQGRYVNLNSPVDLTIENGTQNMFRNDLIVARYTKDTSSDVEEVNLVVIKGTSVESSPVDPEYTSADLLNGNVLINDMPLYRVPINGINVQTPVALFEELDNIEGAKDLISAHNESGNAHSSLFSSRIGAHNSADNAHSALFAAKEDKPTTVTGSGAITVTLADNKDYAYTDVTSLAMTAAAVNCHGFIAFGTSTPTINVSGFAASNGDDITSAAAGEVWEFSVFAFNGGAYIIWQKKGE